MSEDQLVIWKRLNEIRLSQDQVENQAVVVTERLGLKPGKKKATKEPWWKRQLQGQVDQLQKVLSRLEYVCRNEYSGLRIRN